MKTDSQKQQAEEALYIACERLADEKVQEKMGFRGELMLMAAKMASVADVEYGQIVPFADYEKRNIFPVVSMAKGDQIVTTMTAPLPIQQEILRAHIHRSWNEQGFIYNEEDVEDLLATAPNDEITFRYERVALGMHSAARSIRSHRTNESAPYLLRFGRPHVVIQDVHHHRMDNLADTVIHELSHAVDAITGPLLLVPPEELRLLRLQGELAAYATELLVHRAFRSKSEATLETLFPKTSDIVELCRTLINGPYTGEKAFEPNKKIERTLGALGLRKLYS